MASANLAVGEQGSLQERNICYSGEPRVFPELANTDQHYWHIGVRYFGKKPKGPLTGLGTQKYRLIKPNAAK